MSFSDLILEIKSCTKCKLSETRTNAVPGDGNENADIMFIGEGPGKSEDEKGLPFVGAAGKLLSEMLAEVALKREDVYITNIIKCRPPNNRDPELLEVKTCWPYLEKQIELINPKIICFLGRHAMHRFFPSFQISKVHGQCFRRSDGRVYIPLYHPAAALYNGGLKETLFSDFRKIPKVLEKIEEFPKTSEVPKEQKLF